MIVLVRTSDVFNLKVRVVVFQFHSKFFHVLVNNARPYLEAETSGLSNFRCDSVLNAEPVVQVQLSLGRIPSASYCGVLAIV